MSLHDNIDENWLKPTLYQITVSQFKDSISPRIVFSNRPDLDQIVPDESFFVIGPIVVLNWPRWPRADGSYSATFFNMFKNTTDHFFGTQPSEDWGDRARSSSRRYRVVLDSACRLQTIFAKIPPINHKRIRCYWDQNNPWWNGRFTYNSFTIPNSSSLFSFNGDIIVDNDTLSGIQVDPFCQ